MCGEISPRVRKPLNESVILPVVRELLQYRETLYGLDVAASGIIVCTSAGFTAANASECPLGRTPRIVHLGSTVTSGGMHV